MTASVGRTSHLTGQFVALTSAPPEEGDEHMCQLHSKKKAVKLLVGEADSMGCEYIPMCQRCINRYHKRMENQPEHEKRSCESCGSKDDTQAMRDPDEGSCGPVYYWCNACRTKFWKAYHEANPPEDDDYRYGKPQWDFEYYR